MIAFPFDSHISGYDENGYPIYDRATTSEEFSMFFNCLLRDGVFGSGMCNVLAGSGMTATVNVGGMMIRGRFGYIDAPETVVFAAAESRTRIDTVVLRRDLSSSVNNIVCAVVKGTASSNPQPPSLTRDGTIWELGIANVTIPANASSISQSRISDTRLDSSRCGLVAAILTDVDTTALYNQIQSDLEGFKNTEQANFEEWFKTLQTQLEGDVAASLQSQITLLDQRVDAAESNVAAIAAGKLSGITRTAALSTSWSGSGPYTQTVNVNGVTPNSTVLVTPAPSTFEEYTEAAVRASAQGNGTLTFTATDKPSRSVSANLLILEGVKA